MELLPMKIARQSRSRISAIDAEAFRNRNRPIVAGDEMSERKPRVAQITLTAAIAMSVATFSALPTFAADASRDPGGWRQFKWGMSLEEVEKLVPSANFEAYGIGGTLGYLHADNVFSIAQTPVHVVFQFGCNGVGLYALGIGLNPDEKTPDFYYLAEQQYGSEDSVDKSGTIETWHFPTTTIDAAQKGITYVNDQRWHSLTNCPAKDNGL